MHPVIIIAECCANHKEPNSEKKVSVAYLMGRKNGIAGVTKGADGFKVREGTSKYACPFADWETSAYTIIVIKPLR